MKLATVRYDGGTTAALVEGDMLRRLPWPDIGAMLSDGVDGASLRAGEAIASVASADYAPLITRPPKIICAGINYQSHMRELGMSPPAHPTLFSKYHTALTGARDDLSPFGLSGAIDWEAELVVVIGKAVSRATPAEAEAAIAGFCVGNDISARDLQLRTDQWLAGKTLDASTPLGPWLVTVDETGPRPDLAITCHINDVEVQNARTGDLRHDAVDLIVDISAFCRLEPGDIIFTGTPGGIGAARTPKWFLKPGDIVRTEVAGLGFCLNRCAG